MTAGKKYPKSALVGDSAVALCDRRVGEMGFIWRPKPEADVGIDGEIELVDSRTTFATGRVLWVQSRGRTDRFPRETDESFEYVCSDDDLAYWLSCSLPVLLVCSHPASSEAWYKNITTWFADAERRRSRRVVFDKHADRFDASARDRLIQSGAPAPTGVRVRRVPRPESLTSNLLLVDELPPDLWRVPSRIRGWADINSRLRRAGRDTVDDLAWRDGMVYSFRPFDEPPLDILGDDLPERLAFDEFADSSSMDDQRLLVRLLNNTLRQTHRNLIWDDKRQYLYFPASADLEAIKLRPTPEARERTVFTGYPSKKDPSRIAYYRHYALRFQFLRLDEQWVVALTPTYHFTIDGFRSSRFGGERTKKMKEIERNDAVRDLTVFWAGYLRSKFQLFDSVVDIVRFGSLCEIAIDDGIDDASWKSREATSVAADADDDQGTLDLGVA